MPDLQNPDGELGEAEAMHICGVCFTRSDQHDSRCDEPECEADSHLPALCCNGCPCDVTPENEHRRMGSVNQGGR
jgi:hypothetical protein